MQDAPESDVTEEELVPDQPSSVTDESGFPPKEPTITDDILHVSVRTRGPRRT